MAVECNGCKKRPVEVIAFWQVGAMPQALSLTIERNIQALQLCALCGGVLEAHAKRLHLTPGALQILPAAPISALEWEVSRAD